MKKVLAVLLTLTLVFSMSTMTLAAGSSDINSDDAVSASKSQTVVVNVTEGTTTHTYYIVVAWDNLTFSYSTGDKIWDPDNKVYKVENDGWSGANTANVTVTNKSDVQVTITPSVTDNSATDGFKAKLDVNSAFTLASYYGRDVADSKTIEVEVNVDDTPVASATGINVATVNLAISS